MSTTKRKQYRYECPECGSRSTLGAKPRPNTTALYCLECSVDTGKLVKRTSPVLERRKAKSKQGIVDRARKKRQRIAKRERDQFTIGGKDFREELRRVWRVARRSEPTLRKQPPRLIVHWKRSGGRAWLGWAKCWCHEIHLNLYRSEADNYDDWFDTLVHEVAHFMGDARGEEQRGRGKRFIHGPTFQAALSEVRHDLGLPRKAGYSGRFL